MRDARGGFFNRLWRKGAISFRVDFTGHIAELVIVRTSFGAFSLLLDGVPLNTQLKVPKILVSAQDVPLPDGSILRVSPWGAFGWKLKRNGVKISPVSKKPVLVQTVLIVAIVAIVGFGAGLLAWWLQRPDWKKSDPPVWAYLTTSTADTGKTRWFINTKAIRKNGSSSTVKVLLRQQTVAASESEYADVPKDDEYTTVQNFTCDPGKQGYDLSAILRGFSGKQLPGTIPPDSELPRALAWRDFVQVRPGSIIAEAREAACFLAGYR
jgi:hypothetical protein